MHSACHFYYVCFFSSKMGIIMPTSQNCCETELAQAWLRVSMLAVLATTMITFGLTLGSALSPLAGSAFLECAWDIGLFTRAAGNFLYDSSGEWLQQGRLSLHPGTGPLSHHRGPPWALTLQSPKARPRPQTGLCDPPAGLPSLAPGTRHFFSPLFTETKTQIFQKQLLF